MYTDYNERSINIVKKKDEYKEIQPLIKLQGWLPLNLCSTSSGDLLVTMITDDQKQSKVVRYSGSTEKQSIQRDDQGKALFSSDGCTKYLDENRNMDICVADYSAGAVVVVSAAGKLRFRYTSPPSPTQNPFKPIGITTDNHSMILTIDDLNSSIHILDQDGHFLRYMDKCGLSDPVGLCVDSTENLFVAEHSLGEVLKMRYYK